MGFVAKFVMEASMHMIHDMQLEIASEGVETKERMEAISALGIDYCFCNPRNSRSSTSTAAMARISSAVNCA